MSNLLQACCKLKLISGLPHQICHDKLISRKIKLAASVHAIWVLKIGCFLKQRQRLSVSVLHHLCSAHVLQSWCEVCHNNFTSNLFSSGLVDYALLLCRKFAAKVSHQVSHDKLISRKIKLAASVHVIWVLKIGCFLKQRQRLSVSVLHHLCSAHVLQSWCEVCHNNFTSNLFSSGLVDYALLLCRKFAAKVSHQVSHDKLISRKIKLAASVHVIWVLKIGCFLKQRQRLSVSVLHHLCSAHVLQSWCEVCHNNFTSNLFSSGLVDYALLLCRKFAAKVSHQVSHDKLISRKIKLAASVHVIWVLKIGCFLKQRQRLSVSVLHHLCSAHVLQSWCEVCHNNFTSNLFSSGLVDYALLLCRKFAAKVSHQVSHDKLISRKIKLAASVHVIWVLKIGCFLKQRQRLSVSVLHHLCSAHVLQSWCEVCHNNFTSNLFSSGLVDYALLLCRKFAAKVSHQVSHDKLISRKIKLAASVHVIWVLKIGCFLKQRQRLSVSVLHHLCSAHVLQSWCEVCHNNFTSNLFSSGLVDYALLLCRKFAAKVSHQVSHDKLISRKIKLAASVHVIWVLKIGCFLKQRQRLSVSVLHHLCSAHVLQSWCEVCHNNFTSNLFSSGLVDYALLLCRKFAAKVSHQVSHDKLISRKIKLAASVHVIWVLKIGCFLKQRQRLSVSVLHHLCSAHVLQSWCEVCHNNFTSNLFSSGLVDYALLLCRKFAAKVSHQVSHDKLISRKIKLAASVHVIWVLKIGCFLKQRQRLSVSVLHHLCSAHVLQSWCEVCHNNFTSNLFSSGLVDYALLLCRKFAAKVSHQVSHDKLISRKIKLAASVHVIWVLKIGCFLKQRQRLSVSVLHHLCSAHVLQSWCEVCHNNFTSNLFSSGLVDYALLLCRKFAAKVSHQVSHDKLISRKIKLAASVHVIWVLKIGCFLKQRQRLSVSVLHHLCSAHVLQSWCEVCHNNFTSNLFSSGLVDYALLLCRKFAAKVSHQVSHDKLISRKIKLAASVHVIWVLKIGCFLKQRQRLSVSVLHHLCSTHVLQSWCEVCHNNFTTNLFCKWVGRLCFVTLQEVCCKSVTSS
ncbi:hypothetical protein AVEN_69262-1 [Araneus ventricosus]|uniref:Uncharacterized protein n=1 Tax=Araneus ventricosus TaxID=182803 RepID=A0A4Y2WHI4_ARAVE|nr:hypothetical protein AVEN_274135-1 [Araneus ventricosus]GBO37023.1 hypothetical protein AVEN_69262-1 [Araneus ventricosus]